MRFGRSRVFDIPNCENAFAGIAIGAAAVGKRPLVVHPRNDFMFLALDQIINLAAKWRYMYATERGVPIVCRGIVGRGWGQGATHSQSLQATFAHFPGLHVATPASPADAKGLLVSAIRDENPVVFLEHKILYNTKGPVPAGDVAIPMGVADCKRAGRDATFVGVHTMVHKALAAAETLAAEGIDLEVIDPRTLVPFDLDAIVASVRKTGRLVVGHEAYERCGIGAEIIAQVLTAAFDALDAPPVRVCGKNVPIPYNARLEAAALPQAEDIAAAVRQVVA